VEIGERASMVLVARKVVAAKKMVVLGQGVATATAMAMEAVVMAEREVVVKVAATKAAGSSAATKATGSSRR
jgi:hypothetical protein